MRVKIDATGLYTYPDVSVVCGEPAYEDAHRDTLLNPKVIVEVLSPSTEAWDRGRKFEHYRKIPSLQEYLLVAQDAPKVGRFHRRTEDSWILTEATGLKAVVALASLDCRLALADLYAQVDLPDGKTPLAPPSRA